MEKIKAKSLCFSMCMIFALAILSLGFVACGKEKISVSIKQMCNGVEAGYGLITGMGSYEKGSEVTLSVTTSADGYYFDSWKIGNESDINTTKKITINENTNVIANFKKGQKITVDDHIIIVNNGFVNVTDDKISIEYDKSINPKAFSYWKQGNTRYSTNDKIVIGKSNITSDLTLEPVCANTGAFMGVYYTTTEDADVPFTNQIMNYTDLLDKVERTTETDYSAYNITDMNFLRSTTDFEYSILKSSCDSSMQKNLITNSKGEASIFTLDSKEYYRVSVPCLYMDKNNIKNYYIICGKIFLDANGIEVCDIKVQDTITIFSDILPEEGFSLVSFSVSLKLLYPAVGLDVIFSNTIGAPKILEGCVGFVVVDGLTSD